ncbi:hypothetical protein BJ508DRAFT_381060 [Ascobolus immersus RN42]|uniref:C2H2-type domain-containing protein n=1 Tax=Ascobolus immersus RN42 TaxID=1160509 RepID=A0A3N4HKN6_ASCIM|nr:hypothetical protein BJ508DRAFT_381060 [Ascobolus immersus RN42]
MEESEHFCPYCPRTFSSVGQRDHHLLSTRHNRCQITFREQVEDWPVIFNIYTVTVWQLSDLYFYCPFKDCDFHEHHASTFRTHVDCAHEFLVRDGQVQNFKAEVYKEKNDEDCREYGYFGPLAPANDTPRTASSSSSPTATERRIPSSVANTAETTKADAPPTPTITCNKCKADTTRSDLMRASLREEYMKRLHEDMMESLADKTVDFKESAKKREEMKAWFEEGMKMLKEVDGVAV